MLSLPFVGYQFSCFYHRPRLRVQLKWFMKRQKWFTIARRKLVSKLPTQLNRKKAAQNQVRYNPTPRLHTTATVFYILQSVRPFVLDKDLSSRRDNHFHITSSLQEGHRQSWEDP